MDGRGPLVRRAARLSAHGGRNLHDLHLPGRQRLRLWAGRTGLLHSVLRHACLHDVLLDVAADLALCTRSRPLFPGRLFRQQIRQPLAGRAGLAGRYCRAHPLSGAAVQRSRHHRRSRGLWRDRHRAGGLDRRCGRHRLRDDVGCSRLGLDGGRQGRDGPGGRGFSRHLFSAALLRRRGRDVRRHRSGKTRLCSAAGTWRKRLVVCLDGAAHRARLLYVAAHVRLDLYRAQRSRHPPECGFPPALSADLSVRLHDRLCGDPCRCRASRAPISIWRCSSCR